MKKTIAVLLMMLGALMVAGLATTPYPAQSRPGPATLDFREVVLDAKQKVFPTVVYIRVVREATESGKQSSQQVSGSGVIISPRGEVLTNWHVVEKALSVRCLMQDGQAMEAEVVGSDKDTDLALLQLNLPDESPDMPFARIGDSHVLSEGDFVMAMGAPFGLNRSVSIGIISCTRRYLSGASEYSMWLQTDAAINPGNSGGPLVNTNGEVIGINARGIGYAEGMGFAIPSETVELLLPQLRSRGDISWSWTGLQFQPLRDFDRDIYFDQTEGVVVAETDPESPARRAGLKPRDRIVTINGESITGLTEEDLPGVRRAFAMLAKDEPASIEVMRGDDQLSFDITPREKGEVEGKEFVCERWNMTAKAINQFDNPKLYFHRKKGVFIYGLKYPGNASSAGLHREDIILKIDKRPVETLEDIEAIYNEAIESVDEKHRMVFVVLRKGLMQQVVLDYRRDYSRE